MENIKYLIRFAKYLRPYLVKMITIYTLSLLNSGISIILPLLYMAFINAISVSKNFTLLIYLMLIYTILTLFQKLLSYIEDFLSMYCKNFILLEIKSELFNHIQRLPLSYFSKEPPAKLINRITNDVNSFAVFIDGSLKNILNNVFSIIGIIAITKFMGVEYLIITLVSTLCSYLVTILFSKQQKRIEKEQSESRGNIYNSISESLTAIDLVKISATHQIETKKFYNLTLSQIHLSIKAQNISSLRATIAEIIDIGIMASVFVYGGLNVIKGAITIGGLLAIYQYINQLKRALSAFASQYVGLKLVLGILERVIEVFRTEPEENNYNNKVILKKPIRGFIRFENIKFGYSDKFNILEKTGFSINEGDTVLLLGASGIGKTTIIKLLLRYLIPNEGEIFIDDYNIHEINLDCYRKQFGVVLQEIRLFSGTIRENICYGISDVTDDQMINASKISHIHNDIMQLKNGYDTIISANQTELSVGQKQRITLARAIIKDPPILILDEATGAIDINTDKLIMKSLVSILKNRTSIIISHKYISMEIINRVFQIKNNAVVEMARDEYINLFKQ